MTDEELLAWTRDVLERVREQKITHGNLGHSYLADTLQDAGDLIVSLYTRVRAQPERPRIRPEVAQAVRRLPPGSLPRNPARHEVLQRLADGLAGLANQRGEQARPAPLIPF